MDLIDAAEAGEIDAINDPPAHRRFEAAVRAAEHGNGKFALDVLGPYRKYLDRSTFISLMNHGLRTGCTDLTDRLYEGQSTYNPNFGDYISMFEDWIKTDDMDVDTISNYNRLHKQFKMLMSAEDDRRDDLPELVPLAYTYGREALVDVFEQLSTRTDDFGLNDHSRRVISDQAERIENEIVMARGPYYQDELRRDEALDNLLQYHEAHAESVEVALKRLNKNLIEVYEQHAPDKLDEADVLGECLSASNNLRVDKMEFVGDLRNKPYVDDNPEAIVRAGLKHKEAEIVEEGVADLNRDELDDIFDFAIEKYHTGNDSGIILLLEALSDVGGVDEPIRDAFFKILTSTNSGGGRLKDKVDVVEAFKEAHPLGGTLHEHPNWPDAVEVIGQVLDFETAELLYRTLPLRDDDKNSILDEASMALPNTRPRLVRYLLHDADVEPQNLDELVPKVMSPRTGWRVKRAWTEWLQENAAIAERLSFNEVALPHSQENPEEDVAEVVRFCLKLDLRSDNPRELVRKLYELCDREISNPNDNFLLQLVNVGVKPGQELMREIEDEDSALFDELLPYLNKREQNMLNASRRKADAE